MKKIALGCFALVVAALTTASAQVVNGGFENWTGTEPTGWTTNNVPGIYTTVTKVSGRSGFGVQGTVVNYATVALNPLITSLSPATQRYGSLTGYYTFSPVGGDSLIVVSYLGQYLSPICSGAWGTSSAAGSFTQFTLNYDYFTPDMPDTCWISITILHAADASDVHVGSTFVMDDLSLTGTATAVEPAIGMPNSFSLGQNYPNPFNPSTEIDYALASAGHVRLTVFDILGREVARLVDAEEPAGAHRVRFNANGLSSGVYIYRIQTEGFVQQKRMMLLK
jgi:hypothetical protein